MFKVLLTVTIKYLSKSNSVFRANGIEDLLEFGFEIGERRVSR